MWFYLANHLLFEPNERDPIFIQRAEKMLTQCFRGARLENEAAGSERYRLLPYVGSLLNAGPRATAEHLHALDPSLATKFLSGELAETDFEGNRFLLDCWGTLEERLGSRSDYAHSQTLHNGHASSEGRSERSIPLLTSQNIALLSDKSVISWHRENRPMRLTRLDWRDHPILATRRHIPPPPLSPLPHPESKVSTTIWRKNGQAHTGYIDPDKRY